MGSIREGFATAGEKTQDAVGTLADRIEDALEEAGDRGTKVSKQVKKELVRRWKQLDRAGRDNAFIMAIGALGVGILIGYLVTRDRD